MRKIIGSIIIFILFCNVSVASKIDKDSLLKVATYSTDVNVKINALNRLSFEYLWSNQEKAALYANQALKIAVLYKNIDGIGDAYNNLGRLNYERQLKTEALEFYNKALVNFMQTSNLNGLTTCYRGIGLVYKDLGKLTDAVDFLNKALTLGYKLNDSTSIRITLNSLGNVESDKGNHAKALEYFFKSLKIAENMNDNVGMASSYNNIGIIYKNQKEYYKALEFYHKSLTLCYLLDDKRSIAKNINNIGMIYFELKEWNNAIMFFNKSLEINKEFKDKKGVSISCNNLGSVFDSKGDYKKAYEYFSQALNIRLEIDDKKGLASVYYNIGKMYKKQNDYTNSLNSFQKSLEYSLLVGDKIQTQLNYEFISEVYAKLKKYEDAYKYYKLNASMKDSLLKENKIELISDLINKYDSEKKEREIQLLLKDKELQQLKLSQNKYLLVFFVITIIFLIILVTAIFYAFHQKKKTNRELFLLNETLETRVNEEVLKNRQKELMLTLQSRQAAVGEMIGNISHQWRQPLNALGVIIQNIKEAYAYGELTEEYITTKSDKSMSLINYMSQTIDDFRNFFRPDKQKVEFSINEVVNKTIKFLESSFKNNNIKIELDEVENVNIWGFQNEYSQVVINIMNNAKDVFNEKKIACPQINIKIFTNKTYGCLTIEDNGGGIPKNIMEKIFEPYFTTKSNDKGTGIGLYMSKTIIENHMNGKLKVENSENGAIFTIQVAQNQVL